MNLFIPHALVLLVVIAPIAVAERNPFYLAAAALVVIVGYFFDGRARRSLIGPRSIYGVVFAAFGYLIVDWTVLDAVLVVALSHFMMIVCMAKLLQTRKLRDDVQVQVLCLLLLVVGGVVSADVLFVLALVVVLACTIPALIGIHVAVEAAKVVSALPAALIGAKDSTEERPNEPALAAVRCSGVAFGVAAFSVGFGGLVFILCPRFDMSMLRDLDAASVGPALTDLSASMEVSSGQTIRESDRPVMRVLFESLAADSLAYDDTAHYFRSYVSYRYTRVGSGWAWQHGPPSQDGETLPSSLVAEQAWLNPGQFQVTAPLIQYEFRLEPRGIGFLPATYPIVQYRSFESQEVRFNATDHVLQTGGPLRKTVRYRIASPAPGDPGTQPPGDGAGDPGPVRPMDPSLPREAEIRQYIDRQLGDPGPLDVPANREAWLRRLRDFLQSSAFTYSLSLPRVRAAREPIGEFLLETRTGHCEYFASAMAIIAQLKGIPARLVSGYHGGDYNYFGRFLVVRGKHAHAWVEAFIPGQGWVPYDPTPTGWRPPGNPSWLKMAQSYIDYVQFQWGSSIVSFSAGSRRELLDRFFAWVTRPVRDETSLVGAVVAFIGELFGEGRLRVSPVDRVLYWVFSLLVLALVVLIAMISFMVARSVARRVARRGAAGRGTVPAEAEFYSRFVRHLEAIGLRRRSDQTPAEFADELARSNGLLHDAPEVVRGYYEIVYGRRSLSDQRRAHIEAFLQSLRTLQPAASR